MTPLTVFDLIRQQINEESAGFFESTLPEKLLEALRKFRKQYRGTFQARQLGHGDAIARLKAPREDRPLGHWSQHGS